MLIDFEWISFISTLQYQYYRLFTASRFSRRSFIFKELFSLDSDVGSLDDNDDLGSLAILNIL